MFLVIVPSSRFLLGCSVNAEWHISDVLVHQAVRKMKMHHLLKFRGQPRFSQMKQWALEFEKFSPSGHLAPFHVLFRYNIIISKGLGDIHVECIVLECRGFREIVDEEISFEKILRLQKIKASCG